MATADVSVVVVTYNSSQWIERCLESVRDYETIVVDHGSTDGTVELVRRRFPEAHVIEEENLGMGGGNNAGMRLASGRYFLLLNSDAWLVGDGAEQLAGFADQHPDAAVVGPRLLNPDGSLQRSARAFPTLWRLATEYLFLRKLAPRSRALNSFYEGGFDHDEVREVDWLFGACLLVRPWAVALHETRHGDVLLEEPVERVLVARADRGEQLAMLGNHSRQVSIPVVPEEVDADARGDAAPDLRRVR